MKLEEGSRAQTIVDSLLEGGYAELELQEIIDVCEDLIANLENEQ